MNDIPKEEREKIRSELYIVGPLRPYILRADLNKLKREIGEIMIKAIKLRED